MAGKVFTKNPVCNANLGTMSMPASSPSTATDASGMPSSSSPATDPSQIPVDPPAFSTDVERVDTDDDTDEWEAYLDELHLPDAKPGMHFHADFGFVRGSDFRLKTENKH